MTHISVIQPEYLNMVAGWEIFNNQKVALRNINLI